MNNILAEAGKIADEAEVFTVSSDETQVRFETNRLKHIQTRQSNIVALRVIKNGRLGFALTTDLSRSKELVDEAAETSQFGMEARFELPGLTAYPKIETLDSNVKSVSLDTMVKLGNELISPITNHTQGIICESGINRTVVTVTIANSRGGRASYTKSIFGMGVEGTLIRGTDMLFVGDSESSCHPLTETKKITDEVTRQLELAKDIAAVPTRELPVIFTPHGVAGVLVASLVAGFNGKLVLEGASPLGNKIGQSVFDSKLWLWDDPTVPYQPHSRPCDDESVPSQKTTLIEGGRVTNFLYDLQTAALAHTKSTGSAVRSRTGLPSPSPSAFVIGTSDATFEDMVKDIKEGLVIEQVLGAEQGNILGGDFSGNVLLGYKIENGRLVGRVKNAMISGNVYTILKDIAGMGSEARWVDGFLKTPHIYCPRISVASK